MEEYYRNYERIFGKKKKKAGKSKDGKRK